MEVMVIVMFDDFVIVFILLCYKYVVLLLKLFKVRALRVYIAAFETGFSSPAFSRGALVD